MILRTTISSRVLGREETLTIVMPDHLRSIPERLKVLYLFGAARAESDWWLRRSFLENEINMPERDIAAVCLRNDPGTDREALIRELNMLLPAQYPLKRGGTMCMNWNDSEKGLPDRQLAQTLKEMES